MRPRAARAARRPSTIITGSLAAPGGAGPDRSASKATPGATASSSPIASGPRPAAAAAGPPAEADGQLQANHPIFRVSAFSRC